VLTLITDDRPGIFSRVAGVLALHGLDVLSAAAYSSEEGRALAQFRVTSPLRRDIPWPRVVADLELALDGRLAVQARLAERARTYGRRGPAVKGVPPTVTFDDDASKNATVIDVRAPDAVGVLYRITRALVELDLDIRSAKVQTIGNHVVDAFYVRDAHGNKISDGQTLGEVERAILHSLDNSPPG
jgi:[protein-PII] uridylyltransferase